MQNLHSSYTKYSDPTCLYRRPPTVSISNKKHQSFPQVWSLTLMLLFICTVLHKLHRVFGTVHPQKLLLLFQDLLHESGVIPPEHTCKTRRPTPIRHYSFREKPSIFVILVGNNHKTQLRLQHVISETSI